MFFSKVAIGMKEPVCAVLSGMADTMTIRYIFIFACQKNQEVTTSLAEWYASNVAIISFAWEAECTSVQKRT